MFRGGAKLWFHAGHTAMALSMMYMYLSMSYGWNWLPATGQMWFFVVTSVILTAWLLINLLRRQPVNFLWILLLIQHAAMAYMWFPMMRWNAIVIFVLVSWFAIEVFGWAANLFPDDTRMALNSKWFPYEVGARQRRGSPIPARQTAAVPGGGTGAAPGEIGEESAPDCHTSVHLVVSDWKDRTLMAVMALSMGYMFYGMQLMH